MIQACQFPKSISRETKTAAVAILASLLINGGLVLLVGSWLSFQERNRQSIAPKEDELVVSLEELLPQLIASEAKPEPVPAKQVYVETFSDQEAAKSPERAPFESDRNTRAATKIIPKDPGEAPIPTQEGMKEIDNLSMREHNFAEGQDGAIPRSTPTPPGLPVTPGMVQAPDTPQDQAPPDVQAERMTKEKIDDPAKTSPAETKAVAKADDGRSEEAPPAAAEKLPEGKPGGITERMEMAKVDLPGRVREVAGEQLDETVPPAKREDAMPEKAPQLSDPTVPFLQSPRVRASAPSLATSPMRSPSPPSLPVPSGAAPRPLTNGEADMAAFSPARRLNTMKGSLSNAGANAVDAEATPIGAYKAALSRVIERRWQELRQKNGTFVSYGSLKIRFLVNRSGKVSGLRVVHQDAGAVLTSFSLEAIASAKIPPMPEEVAQAFDNEPLEVSYDILIY